MNASSDSNVSQSEEKEDDNVVTLLDVLEEEDELEADANAVLGGADDKICTYSKGYLFRQPLYACATCNTPSSKTQAGICLACSYHCHEGHELIELYTKRNFRCDCGNSLFPDAKCNLDPVKDDTNELNVYNQNFSGTYCTCKRPYPDPEDNIEDEMIQCIVCEDWFHKRHLGVDRKMKLDFGEMICQGCMVAHTFLWKYSGLCVKPIEKESGDDSLNISVAESSTNGCEESRGKQKEDQSCYLKTSTVEIGSGPTFWLDGWRKNLCQCVECIALYEKEKVSFLISETDTVQYYENQNKELAKESQKESQNEKVMQVLSSLDRVKQVEVIEGYNQMKSELTDYLQKFVENRKVVREEDIREFFSQMQARKKHKVEVPYFCR